MHLLSVIGQAKRRCIPRLRLPPRVPARKIRNDIRNLGCVLSGQIELALSPAGNVCIEIIGVPDGRIPSEGNEELRVHLVGFHISYVQDPDRDCVASYGKLHLLVSLCIFPISKTSLSC